MPPRDDRHLQRHGHGRSTGRRRARRPARDGDNLEVVGFATGPGTMDVGDDFVDLRIGGFDPAHRTVAAECERDHTELALELRRGPSPSPGVSRGFTVSYRSAAGQGEMEVPFHVTLCPAEIAYRDCAPSTE